MKILKNHSVLNIDFDWAPLIKGANGGKKFIHNQYGKTLLLTPDPEFPIPKSLEGKCLKAFTSMTVSDEDFEVLMKNKYFSELIESGAIQVKEIS